jgi:flagella basal body P-ring formation protein FlgA
MRHRAGGFHHIRQWHSRADDYWRALHRSSPWTLYVPVAVAATSPVVFTTRPVLRGERIAPEALELRYVPLQRMPRSPIRNAEQAVGMEATRAIAADSPLALSNLRAPQLVKQGQEVIILAEGGGISVRMSGSALKSGSKDEMIPIKNLSSGKTLEARIVSDSTVLVGF